VAFESYSNNLVNGDTNNIRDIFIQGPTAYTPLQAGFSASPTSGVAPLLVTFTNQTNGYFTAILWDFGDAITSTLMSPTHTFAAPGIYTITLTATGPGGMDTLTWPGYIDVHRPLSLYLPLVQRK
jgi:PKD repeat protein